MATIFVGQFFRQLSSIGEVSVMDQHNAVGRVHIKRLCFLFLLCVTPGRIANVSQTDSPLEAAHVPGSVSLTDLTAGFANVESVLIRCRNTGGVLTAVLKER